MKNKSIKTSSVIFILALAVQILAVTGNFYLQHRLDISHDKLEQYQGVEGAFFKALSQENTPGLPPSPLEAEKTRRYDRVIEKIQLIHHPKAEALISKRERLLHEVTVLAAEKQEMHQQIRSLLPSLANSIQYIHDHHIAHLNNLISRGTTIQDYDRVKPFKKKKDQSAPETYIIKAAIDIHASMLTVFETFAKLQLGLGPNIIQHQFNTAIHNFYQAINTFEDSSLDAQDGILIEELIINGQAFESRFKRFLEIESQIMELTNRLAKNKALFIHQLDDQKKQLTLKHDRLTERIRLLQILSLTTFAAMILLVFWYGAFLVRGFQRMIIETQSIQNDIGYRIPNDPKGFKEFCVVSQALNAMGDTIQSQVQALEASKLQLEQRVKERTQELSVVNKKLKKEIQERIVSENERKMLEKRLIQSHKMEAIGTLSGGIAHDFNNILSGIFGYSELALNNIDSPQKLEGYINQIINGARRAAALIQQILTFSRQTENKKSPLMISVVVKEALKLLRSTIPSSIDIQENIASSANVLADPTQIHQVIMNLCTNGYHAMRDTGGTLEIELVETDIQNQKGDPVLKIPPGRYIRLTISDTGTGMSQETITKIFDPYFTTKKIGEGTGLGLALTYGIIEEHQGYIRVQSTPGQGSQFYVFLPVINIQNERNITTESSRQVVSGTEKIMIVDDETDLLNATLELLQDYGYQVTAFSNPESALDAFKKQPNAFDLLITDMTMPRMSGDELSIEILKIRKEMPIILCTGYSDRITKNDALQIGICRYFQKPVNSHEMALSIREILDSRKEGPNR